MLCCVYHIYGFYFLSTSVPVVDIDSSCPNAINIVVTIWDYKQFPTAMVILISSGVVLRALSTVGLRRVVSEIY